MRALILAAGRGTRLGLPGDGPKCLADVGGRSILARSLDALDGEGISATIVVGHQAALVEQHVEGRTRTPLIVMNERYREGSVLSLAGGLSIFDKGDDVVLLDGDVVYAPELLHRLLAAKPANALLVDASSTFTDEQYMAGMKGKRVVALRRGPVTEHESCGEWIGLTKLGARAAGKFRAAAEAQIARGETTGGYEDALAGLLSKFKVTGVPTGGLPWVEVDFAADLGRARELFAR